MALSELASAVGASALLPEATVSRWSTDSRTIEPGAVFFALRGDRFAGGEFLPQAFERGAAAAVAEQPLEGKPVLVVRDALEALQAAAARARKQFAGRVIAVTGSAGKTTTKDAIAHLLAAVMPVSKNAGNLNNHVGLPLSVLRLGDDARAAVLEMGMNHAGEIRRLTRIARPQIGVVTNIGSAHAGFFEDGIEGVARAKRELVEELGAGGTAVLNADDPRVAAFRTFHAGPTVTYGLAESADVRAEAVEFVEDGVRFSVDGVGYAGALEGRHGLMNLLGAIAVARECGIAPEQLRDPVRSFTVGTMRGLRSRIRGVMVFDDCYNSNPEAARAMLDLLARTQARRRIAVLGEMLELGRWAEALHGEVGDHAARCGIDVLVGIRGAARHLVDQARRAGMQDAAACFFDDPEPAGDFLRELLRPGDAVLFKGSRGTQVDRALKRWQGE